MGVGYLERFGGSEILYDVIQVVALYHLHSIVTNRALGALGMNHDVREPLGVSIEIGRGHFLVSIEQYGIRE